MAEPATLSSTWKKRMGFIILFCVGLGLYFFYDGAIGYPKKNEAFLKHKELKEAGRESAWPATAKRHGWDVTPPEKLHDEGDLMGQYVFGTVTLALGGCAIAWVAMCWKRTLRSDAEAVYGDTGVRVPFSEMRSVDRRKWDTKGIAVVLYERDGKKRRLVLDDYKYAGGEKILQEVEQYLEGAAR